MAALSLLLLVVGAVLAFAVNAAVDNVDLVAVGVIMMIVGAIGLIASLALGRGFGRRWRTERDVSSDGRHVVERQSSTRL